TLCIGKTSLWDVHYYVTTNDGTKLSGTPDVAYVNGDIAETRKIDAFTRNRLFTEHDTAIPIDSGFSPMVWHPLGDRSGLLSSAGIDIGLLLDRHSTQNFDIRFFHEVQLVESGRETGSLRVRVTIPKDQLIKIQQALAAVPASETVQELQRLGIEVNIVASFLRPASEAQIINEQSRTIDALHFLITKLSREIVDRFTYAPRSVVDHPDYGNRLRHHASVPALSQI
ncbi:MAG: hypothetical protein WCG78_08505, partial [Candidatus Omnitrophota bacterium]